MDHCRCASSLLQVTKPSCSRHPQYTHADTVDTTPANSRAVALPDTGGDFVALYHEADSRSGSPDEDADPNEQSHDSQVSLLQLSTPLSPTVHALQRAASGGSFIGGSFRSSGRPYTRQSSTSRFSVTSRDSFRQRHTAQASLLITRRQFLEVLSVAHTKRAVALPCTDTYTRWHL